MVTSCGRMMGRMPVSPSSNLPTATGTTCFSIAWPLRSTMSDT